MSEHHDKKQGHEEHHHHILADSFAYKLLGVLLLLTVVTVAIAQVDLGALNFPVAMLVASIKASLVCMFFMGLKYDNRENTVIFSTSFIFMVIFMVLTFGDLLTRGDVYVKDFEKGGPIVPAGLMGKAPAKFKKAWVSTAELVEHGKEQYKNQCVSCHGAEGAGNGPAAAGLNPKPRNFTAGDGWKNGAKASQIFGTLTKGLNSMPAFGTLPAEDRWALAHYVRTFGPHAGQVDSPADFAKVGVDPSKEDGGDEGEKSIPIDAAIQIMSDS